MVMPPDDRSFSDLLADALNRLTTLVRTEIQLARTEISLKISKAATGIAMVMGSAAFAISGLVLILLAIAAWLDNAGLSRGVSNLIAGILGALVSAGLAWAGLQRLRADQLAPNRTMEQLQRDAMAAKEQLK
jgi:Putative Actinobacterial Holin-X, holin superfamily III